MLWDNDGDQISVPVKDLLRETAEVFDPLGYFSPVLINTKLLLKNL